MAELNPNFICPITAEVMVDPVIDPEGNSYERRAILDWLSRNLTSPVTRAPLYPSSLVPNRALKSMIEEYTANNVTPRPAAISGVVNVVRDQSTDGSERDSGVGIVVSRSENIAIVTVVPPGADKRTPSDIVIVVDTSGSMGSSASASGAESSGLSILDIVKHAIKTIISVLGPDDRLSVISYSNAASIVFDLLPMNDAGKARANSLVNSLDADGMTNLWDGLHKGLEMLSNRDASVARVNSAVLLLTDGEPNIEPPRGHIPTLQRYRDTHDGKYPGVIATFGFGYTMDSPLLRAISVEGGGMYAFIPDSGFVGTAFINALGNLLVTRGSRATLCVEPINGARITSFIGDTPHTMESWGVAVPVDTIHYGQNRDFAFELADVDGVEGPVLSATLRYESTVSREQPQLTVDGPDDAACYSRAYVLMQSTRQMAVGALNSIIQEMIQSRPAAASTLLTNAIASIRSSLDEISSLPARDPSTLDQSLNHRQILQGLLSDFEGQITQAVTRSDYYQKWGKHYLPSLQRAHLLQQCNNFKDPGVQFYGGEAFRRVRDYADDMFSKLPAPTPSNVVYPTSAPSYLHGGSVGAAPARAAPVSMASFNSASAPCFHGDCLVAMYDGTEKAVSRLLKGDKVILRPTELNSKEANFGVVECLVRTTADDLESGFSLLEFPSGLQITSWHPIRMSSDAPNGNDSKNSSWLFPIDSPSAVPCRSPLACKEVFSIVLAPDNDVIRGDAGACTRGGGRGVLINGIECATLGHGIVDDQVISHPYYGTQRVIDSLSRLSGWNNGCVDIKPSFIVRDSITGLVCDIKTSK